MLYDRDCGFCRWCVGWVLRLDRRARLRTVALQEELAAELLPSLSADGRIASWHLVGAGGAVLSGGAAVRPILALLWPRLGPIIGRILSPLAELGYPWVAENRSRFGKLVSDGALGRADRLIAERARQGA